MAEKRKTLLFFQTGSPVLARRKLAGAAKFAREKGWRIIATERYDASFKPREQIESVSADAVIAECSGPHDEFDKAALSGVPHVFLCRDPAEIGDALACVSNDSLAVGRMAADALAGKARSFVFVGWYESVYWSDRKLDAFAEALAEREKPVHVFAPTPRDRRDSALFRRRLSSFLTELPRPIGIFAVCDETGAIVEDACELAGVKIGTDVSILSVNDDEPLCESLSTPLASIRLDYERTGYVAASIIDGYFGGRKPADRLFSVLPLGITRRASLISRSFSDAEIADALEFIRTNATDRITAADVAARFNCSRRPAEMKFKAATGNTFAEAIIAARIEAAKKMLGQGKKSVAAVASFCGWNSETLFRRQFRHATGLSPLQYRLKSW